jgi:hypothetical protein
VRTEAKDVAPRMEAQTQRASRWDEERVVAGEGRARKCLRMAVPWYQWKARERSWEEGRGEGERWVSWRRVMARRTWMRNACCDGVSFGVLKAGEEGRI